ncbi:pentatricopeptide repeat-containing protein At1g55630-like [Cicer arietinum]|uniref:Pentatricopeptide repeat-containing protein At1g55630-like n=1 Tax=Cicer arietinum TaxID=3827 RepID=A0A1S3E365_CICAR|nr:pentatricopeptide repeat-containing protein At1g55630-like [Cicer arietinum]XP_012570191.1 pentatricopeptide repeat-containing protein At1g55630-like [Cicer arietinum]XP_027189481.1 pentatricopeptide repeat-containing protein At1g55630-like [Cicer arietinum]XP_027189482.1 pentatricopeptide repeat-containing protein At1g55630-like [Cicer arietinum]XP_027189483.1 pentatricopeptide repeat-containing protein At1g55630-like [Cicer arietinum]
MNSIALLGVRKRVVHKISNYLIISRRLCNRSFDVNSEFECVEEPLKKIVSDFDSTLDERLHLNCDQKPFSLRQGFIDTVKVDAKRVLEILRQDGPGFDARLVLDELRIRPSGILVREVLLGILKNINSENKTRCAKLAYKFFVWCSQQEAYRHTANAYHLIMNIYAECEEFKAVWRLVDEMIEKDYPATARTFNILIRTCGEVGLAKTLMERFIKSKTFNYRPFKHSYNAILHSLLVLNQYKLIEWVYEQMLLDGFSSDVLTYNIVMYAKYRLGKVDQFHILLDEMERNGFSPDFHTYNILLHALGKGDKPLAALNLLNHMRETGIEPTVLHFTTLIDGLSRAGNLDACRYFFDEMRKNGCMPDVVAYTVMITGYVVAGELEKAQEMFQEMLSREQVPNVFTYNSIIRGLCMAGKFDEACSMLKEMENKGCSPNAVVYISLVSCLRNAGKVADAREVIRQMMETGKYTHLLSRFKGYKI